MDGSVTASIWLPRGVDPDGEVVAVLSLAELDTPDGPARFMVGAQGRFVSVDGREWWGSGLIGLDQVENGLGGTAPAGRATLSFFQDPDAPDILADVRQLGMDWLNGYAIRLYLQVLRDEEDFTAPSLPPFLHQTRTMRALDLTADGPLLRVATLEFEAVTEGRRHRRGYFYTTEDHAALIGRPNPSLSLMPTSDIAEEPLF